MTTITRGGVDAQTRAPGWTVVVAQGGYAALYALCGVFAFAQVGWSVPVADDSVAASPGWVLPVGAVLSVAPIFAGLGLLVSAMLFLLGYATGRRRLTVALLASTAATVLVLVVSLTPAAQSMVGRLLD